MDKTVTIENVSLPQEQWRPVAEYEGLYEVSSFGRVYCHPRHSKVGGICGGNKNGRGYHRVNLSRHSVAKVHYVASLVAIAFHGPRPSGHHAAHSDGNKNNNHAVNIRWATPQENSDDKRLHGTVLRGQNHPAAKLTNESVQFIRNHYQPRHRQFGGRALARRYGVSVTTVERIICGMTWRNSVSDQSATSV